jgi:hypothetical protein
MDENFILNYGCVIGIFWMRTHQAEVLREYFIQCKVGDEQYILARPEGI